MREIESRPCSRSTLSPATFAPYHCRLRIVIWGEGRWGQRRAGAGDAGMSAITTSMIRSRPVASAAIAIAAVGAAAILGAWTFQYGLGLQPCPLCLEQRY